MEAGSKSKAGERLTHSADTFAFDETHPDFHRKVFRKVSLMSSSAVSCAGCNR